MLAESWDLPLPAGNYPILAAIAADVARLKLYDDVAPDRVLGRASSARKRLRELADGRRHLVDAAGRRVPRRSEARSTTSPARFTRASLRDL